MICSTEGGRWSVYQNGSTAISRASGREERSRSKSAVIAAWTSSARSGIEKLSLRPMVINTMSGCEAITSLSSSLGGYAGGRAARWLTNPRPFVLGLTSVQPRSAQICVDQRSAGSEAPVPRV